MDEKNNFALVRKQSSAVEKAAPGAKRVLAGMVAETVALAEAKALLTLSPNASPLFESWYQKGENYFDGKGVPQDYVEAEKWFRMAAEKGHAEAQRSLGFLFQTGMGVVQNFDEAIAWYQKSAEQGDMYGQYSLGECHEHGFGVPENCKEAAKWFRKAAEQGDALSQRHLASFYRDGDGVSQDFNEAIRWLKKAAEQNDEVAMLGISSLYENELNDLVEAFKWLKIATDQCERWEVNLNRLQSSLTKEQIAEGEKRYREFQSSKK